MKLPFANTYVGLPDRFFGRVLPTRVKAPGLIGINDGLAEFLGIDPVALGSAEGVEVLAGNQVAEGSEPLAMAYAGHQFGHFVPQLGDGRANLLGEVIAQDGLRYDVQLKGAGRTPYSRGGDGRAAVGPVVREYIVSEAMAALGVPTTRALAAVTTGEAVYRETALPGAVLTRVAASHLRVGTFQFFWARGDGEGLKVLADYAIARHYPEAAGEAKPYRALLDGVIGRHARLVAQWMLLGFVHGVMNTDNTSISGETLDYGPCAFLERYDPATVFSSIDRGGRYAYANQPHAAHWNLTRLAETLLPLLEAEEGSAEGAMASAQEALGLFAGQYEAARTAGLLRKIGIGQAQAGDEAIGEGLLAAMAATRADFTATFRGLCGVVGAGSLEVGLDEWVKGWRRRVSEEGPAAVVAERMRGVNPVYVPRNHLVAAVIAAAERGEYGPFAEMVEVGRRPFEEQAGRERYGVAARAEEVVTATFCGT